MTLLQRLLPFLFLGVMLVLFIFGLILFSYLLIAGVIAGSVLFLVAWIKRTFFPSKITEAPPFDWNEQGRIIVLNDDDYKKQ